MGIIWIRQICQPWDQGFITCYDSILKSSLHLGTGLLSAMTRIWDSTLRKDFGYSPLHLFQDADRPSQAKEFGFRQGEQQIAV